MNRTAFERCVKSVRGDATYPYTPDSAAVCRTNLKLDHQQVFEKGEEGKLLASRTLPTGGNSVIRNLQLLLGR